MIYITYDDLYAGPYTGIRKKVKGQMQVFGRYFRRAFFTCYSHQMLYLMEGDRVVDKGFALTRKECNGILCGWLDAYSVGRTYIRYALSDRWFIEFLKAQRQRGIRTVLEIPTFPYDGTLPDGRVKLEDGYYREHLSEYVEVVATNSNEGSIWGMKCICLVNGIDMKANPPHMRERERGRIVLVGVGGLSPWHGYERVLEGIYNYYKKGGGYDFLFKIIGDGVENGNYDLLTEKYGIQQHVEFLGRMEGRELDRQYDLSDIAVSSLGFYKIDVNKVSAIKSAEYCARGIPFICGYDDMRFNGGEEFIMYVPNSAEPLDMGRVASFYEGLADNEAYAGKMRGYALNNFTWDAVMGPVVNYLL